MKQTLFYILIVLLVSACGAVTSPDNPCIQPSISLAYPVSATLMPNASPSELPPLAEMWQVEAELPISDVVSSIVASPEHEIWIGTSQSILKYDIDTDEWKSYTSIDDNSVVPAFIFLSNGGIIWGSGLNHLEQTTRNTGLPLLSRYDKGSDQFKFVNDSERLLIEDGSARYTSNFVEDKNGLLWLILYYFDTTVGTRSALYSFNPHTLDAKNRLIASLERQEFRNFSFGPDGKIWIIEFGSVGTRLVQYDPINNTTTPYNGMVYDDGIPQEDLVRESDFNNINNLYLDRANRLWVDDRGWLSFTDSTHPIWYKIVRSPVFISDFSRPESQYEWLRPYFTYESSNGQLWFSSHAGMVRLDPEKADWCLFTTGYSPIAEDNDRTLWISVFGKLYKHKLSP